MDDQNNPAPITPDPAQSPAGGSSQHQTNPPNPAPGPDAVKMAEELGRLKKVEQDYKGYIEKVDPFIQTVWSDQVDQETRDKLVVAHNKRLGVTPDVPDNPPSPETPIPPSKEGIESKNYLTKQAIKDFYARHGIDKLEKEKQDEINNNVTMVLRETLNPTGGKTLTQIFDDVPLESLPDQLDKAYFWATRHEREAGLKEEARREAAGESAGIIGSIPSGSSPSGDDTTLSVKELEVIKNAGWNAEGYLKNKKEIASRGQQIY